MPASPSDPQDATVFEIQKACQSGKHPNAGARSADGRAVRKPTASIFQTPSL